MATNAELAADLKSAREHIEALDGEIGEAKERIEGLEGEVVEAKEAWSTCAEENDRLKSSLDAANAAGADPALQEKLDALLKDNDELKERLGDRTDAAIAEAEEAAENLDDSREYVVNLKRHLNVARKKLFVYDQKASIDTGSVPISMQHSQARQELVKRVEDLKAEHGIATDALAAAIDRVNPDLAA